MVNQRNMRVSPELSWALGEFRGVACMGEGLEHRERGAQRTEVWTPCGDAGRRGRKGGPRRKRDAPWTEMGAQPRTKPRAAAGFHS